MADKVYFKKPGKTGDGKATESKRGGKRLRFDSHDDSERMITGIGEGNSFVNARRTQEEVVEQGEKAMPIQKKRRLPMEHEKAERFEADESSEATESDDKPITRSRSRQWRDDAEEASEPFEGDTESPFSEMNVPDNTQKPRSKLQTGTGNKPQSRLQHSNPGKGKLQEDASGKKHSSALAPDAAKADKGTAAANKPVSKDPHSGSLIHRTVSVSSKALHESAQTLLDGDDDENVGLESTSAAEKAVSSAARKLDNSLYARKLSYGSDEPMEFSEMSTSNRQSKRHQKENAKKNLVRRYNRQRVHREEERGVLNRIRLFFSKNKPDEAAKKGLAKIGITVGAFALLLIFLLSSLSSCSVMFEGGGTMTAMACFTAAEEDLLGIEEDYTAMEQALAARIANIEHEYPGYANYVYELDHIGHDPYALCAFMTVQHEAFLRRDRAVQDSLKALFNSQYFLETSTSEGAQTITHEDGTVETVTSRTLTVKLHNSTIGLAVMAQGLKGDDLTRYQLLLKTKGLHPDLFRNYAGSGGLADMEYDPLAEPLTAEQYRALMKEAEKYKGYPYVLGGSSPSSSFDCSGLVSWVINHSIGSFKRQRANEIRVNICTYIPLSDAQPGDLIFFQGTYDTPGASHVAIYCGNDTIFHAGNPIGYAKISNYLKKHYLCCGRIKKEYLND